MNPFQQLRFQGPLGEYVVEKWTTGSSLQSDEHYYFHFNGVRLVNLPTNNPSRDFSITVTGLEVKQERYVNQGQGLAVPKGMMIAINKLVDILDVEQKLLGHDWLASHTGGGGTLIETKCRKCGVVYNASSPPSDKCRAASFEPTIGSDYSRNSSIAFDRQAPSPKEIKTKNRPERKPRFTKDDSDD